MTDRTQVNTPTPSPFDISHEDPIVALASGHGVAAVSLIRISGHSTHTKLKAVLSRPPSTIRHVTLTPFVDPADKVTVDSLLAVYFGAPRSFTGEEGAELYCHGSPFIVRRILEVLQKIGFRMAEPGEFTKRAFLNGKLDLTQAEGIRELVEAQTESQWYAASQLAQGHLSTLVESLKAKLVHAMAYLEARIDFPDEDEPTSVDLTQIRTAVGEVSRTLEQLSDNYASGQVAARGLRVSLLGEPNSGKSTLLNTLLQRDRAIVTDIAGTTRDYLEEACIINGRLIRLIDTAGLRETEDRVEKIGVQQARKLAAESDLVLLLMPATMSAKEAQTFMAATAHLDRSKTIAVLTKSDLDLPEWASAMVPVSCHAVQGLEQLKEVIARASDLHYDQIKSHPFVTNARHLNALKDARQALKGFEEAAEAQQYDECLAFELQAAARALQSIVGEIGTEDLLDRIFRDFCIGK